MDDAKVKAASKVGFSRKSRLFYAESGAECRLGARDLFPEVIDENDGGSGVRL
jgi:hypothetical protein